MFSGKVAHIMLLTQRLSMHEQVMHSCGPRLACTLEAPAAAGSALVVPGFFECAEVFALRLRFTKVRCWLWADGDPPTR